MGLVMGGGGFWKLEGGWEILELWRGEAAREIDGREKEKKKVKERSFRNGGLGD